MLPPSKLKDQELRVQIYDRDARTQALGKQEFIGSAVCKVSEVIQSGSFGKKMALEDANRRRRGGFVVLIGELVKDNELTHDLYFDSESFKLKNSVLTKPYICIYRRRLNNEWAPIFRSRAVHKNEDQAFSEDLLRHVCIRTYNRRGTCEETPLLIELRAHRSNSEHKLLGVVQMSL